MKTKIVYAVVSSNEDTYIEQALISAYSVRLHNPEATIELVTDNDTESTLTGNRAKIKEYVSKIISIDVPNEFSIKQRSRYLKTNIRRFVTGDYLFLDTDTIVCASLSEVDDIPYEICAVREQNKYNKFSKDDGWMYELACKVGLEKELRDQKYFNSGVMYVKDVPNAYVFYDKWYDCWTKLNMKGLSTDQTALCWANKLIGGVVKHIDDSWNCQIKRKGFYQADKAKILHYYYGAEKCELIVAQEETLNTIKEIGFIPVLIKQYIENPLRGFVVDYDEMKFQKGSCDIKYLYNKQSSVYKMILFICKLTVSITSRWIC